MTNIPSPFFSPDPPCQYWLLIGGFKEKKRKKTKRQLVLYRWPFWFVAPLPPRSASSRYLTEQPDHVATIYTCLPEDRHHPRHHQHCNVFSCVCSMFLDCYIVNLKEEKKKHHQILSPNVFLFSFSCSVWILFFFLVLFFKNPLLLQSAVIKKMIMMMFCWSKFSHVC